MDTALNTLYMQQCILAGTETNSAIVKLFSRWTLRNTAEITEIDLRKNYMNAAGINALCAVLLTLRSIKRIDCNGMKMSDASVLQFIQLCEVHPALEEIDLRGNDLFDSTARTATEMLRSSPQIALFLVSLDDISPRIAKRLHQALTRNLAIKFPVVDLQTVDTEVERTESQISDKEKKLLERYRELGIFATQFVADFGQNNVGLLDCCTMEEDPLSVIRSEAEQLVRGCEENGLVRRIVEDSDSLVLLEQVTTLSELVTNMDLGVPDTITSALYLLNHVRDSVALVSSKSIPELESVEDRSYQIQRELIDREFNSTRKLQLLCGQLQYLNYNESKECAAAALRYQAKRPLRIDWESVEESLAIGSSFSQKRQELLKELATTLPSEFVAFLVEQFFAHSMQQAHLKLLPIQVEHQQQQQSRRISIPFLVEVPRCPVTLFARVQSEADLLALCRQFAAHQRYKTIMNISCV